MTSGGIAFLALVIATMVVFSGVLAWGIRQTNRKD